MNKPKQPGARNYGPVQNEQVSNGAASKPTNRDNTNTKSETTPSHRNYGTEHTPSGKNRGTQNYRAPHSTERQKNNAGWLRQNVNMHTQTQHKLQNNNQKATPLLRPKVARTQQIRQEDRQTKE